MASILAFCSLAARADEPPSPPFAEVGTGSDMTPNGWFGYTNVVAALNGDVMRPGLLLRADFGTGQYHYTSRRELNHFSFEQTFHGDSTIADLMIGYAAAFGPVYVKAFLGPEYANFSLKISDSDNSVTGELFGVRALADCWINISDDQWLSTSLSYSTAFNIYQVRSQWGFRIVDPSEPNLLAGLAIGLEESALGNTVYNEGRFGAFAQLPVPNVGEVRISAGVSTDWQSITGDYAQINIFSRF